MAGINCLSLIKEKKYLEVVTGALIAPVVLLQTIDKRETYQ